MLNRRGWPGYISMSGEIVLSLSSVGRIGIFVTQLSVLFESINFCSIKFHVIFVVCHVDNSNLVIMKASFCFSS